MRPHYVIAKAICFPDWLHSAVTVDRDANTLSSYALACVVKTHLNEMC